MAFLAPVVLALLSVGAAALVKAQRARELAELTRRSAIPLSPIEPVASRRDYGAETADLRVDIADLVVDAADRFVPRAQEARIELAVLIDDTMPQALWGPTGTVHRLLVNFIGNAIALTKHGSVIVIATAVDGPDDDAVVRFSVSDGGTGFSRNDALTFFQPHDDETSSDEAGFGWAESCRLIDQMEGRRGVIGRPGVGSTVWFTVSFRKFAAPIAALLASAPLAPEPEPDPEPAIDIEPEPEPTIDIEPEPEPEPEPQPAPKRRGNLLVADDSAVNRRVTTVMLQRTGYQVEVVTDGLEAVRALAQRSFDAVIMDCRMPRVDGLEATGQIRAAEGVLRHTPIIGLTVAASDEDRAAAMAAGMDDYLVKPVDAQKLLDTIDRWIPRPPPLETDHVTTGTSPSRPVTSPSLTR